MITSNSNQYLPPDYFSLPTTLDSKKSPLALLAQTCSQIGADPPSTNNNNKNGLSSDKSSKKSDSSREKFSPSSSSTSSRCSPVTPKSSSANYKPYETNFGMKDPQQHQYNNIESRSSQKSDENHNKTYSINHKSNSSSHLKKPYDNGTAGSSPGVSGCGKISRKSVVPREVSPAIRSYSNPPATSPLSGKTPDSISSLKALSTMPSSSTTNNNNNYFPGYPTSLPLDLMTSSLFQNSLKAGVNPYFNYSRMKMGAESLIPACRDPYCASCQLSTHLLATAAAAQTGKPACPAGCTQCNEIKSAGLLSNSHGNAIAAAYAQAQLAALAAASQMPSFVAATSQLPPYICSWIGGDATYCGKRCATSEELLQHLRSHTSDSLLLNSFMNRTYPTPSLSPLSASRYHPYSKSPYMPSALFPFQNAASVMQPSFSPYFLYGSKLGSPHP